MKKIIFISFLVLLIVNGCSVRNMNTLPKSMSESINSVSPLLVDPILRNPEVVIGKDLMDLVSGSTGYLQEYDHRKEVKFTSANYFSPNGQVEILEDLRTRYMVMLDKKSFHRDVARWGIKKGVLILGFNISNKEMHYYPWVLVKSDNLPNDQYYVFEYGDKKPNYRGIISFRFSDLERNTRLQSTCMLAKNPPNIQCCEGTPDFSNWLQSSACKALARGWDQQSADINGQFREGLKQIFSGGSPFTPNIIKKAICGAYGGNC